MAKERNILALTGTAAIIAVALNFLITTINKHKNNYKSTNKDIPRSNVRVNLSASEILKLADQIIAKSKAVHHKIASVPLDEVTYANCILPLADLEAEQFPLVQSCVFPKMVTVLDDVRKASDEAERRIDAHVLICSVNTSEVEGEGGEQYREEKIKEKEEVEDERKGREFGVTYELRLNREMEMISKCEDVYRVINTFAAKMEQINPEAKRYVQCLVKGFERNGMNLTLSKREEVQRLRTRIDELSMQYVQNLRDDGSFILFNERELDGMPPKFIKSLDKAENGQFKITLRRHHISPLLDHCKVGATRKRVAVAYGQRCGKANLPIVENMTGGGFGVDLVQLRHKLARLLGYSSYVDYAVERRMAKNSAKVFEFLEHISARLTDLAAKELGALKDLKKNEEGDSPFGIEDILYYLKRAEEQKFCVDR
ncbi:hypothetical protein IFM89_023790 [Coptis chinensis]|uniref:Peptidase M3A/M3B catalytic domain-containing protein n=1 Tax=Coptis chinensis TaxID=261450 RepID=A0A835LWD6_9MAGN|nr:hypothetical protein IFM89_023790 [Coptis chinensis]